MPQRIFMDAGAQSTCASAINSTQTSVTLQSASGFTAPATGQQFSVVMLDTGNPAYNAASPLSTPYEYQQVNSVSANTLQFGPGGGSASRAAYAGTTPKAFFAGATIAQTMLAEDINASFPCKLGEQLLTVATSPITFASIPQGFRQLELRATAKSDQASVQGIYPRFNGDAGGDYDYQFMNAVGGTVAGGNSVGTATPFCGNIPPSPGVAGWGFFVLEIPYYASTNQFKPFFARSGYNNGSGSIQVQTSFCDWTNAPSANPITSVSLYPGTGLFMAGSLFTLYGIP